MLTFYDGEDLVDYQALYDDFLNRTALTETTAIKKEQIYIIKNTVLVARRPIGLLYLAKWFHPELFADIDPAVIHEEYVQTFFGSELSGVFVYPEDAIEPEPTETEPTETEPTETEPTETEPETVTVVDKTGASVEITVPVERIVNIAPGAVEIICALGHEDKIVGRDEYSTFPSSVIDIPVVAESSFSPNMELIMELDPDLVIADEGLSEENRATLEDAGIPVLIEMLMEPRLTACMSNLGLILDAETKAAELVDFYTYYEGIVTERVGDLAESEKPSVYFEWYMPWYSSEPGDSWNELVTTAGGTDIVSEVPASGPELSAEFVAEQNPDVVIRMLTRLDGEDLEAFQALKTDFLTRTALTDTTAVKEENVFIIKNTLLVLRRPVGLLYMAKWFHPSLFADIDPGAIHEEMIQQFFGEDLEGVYAYPEIATAFDGNDAEVTVNLPVERIVSVNGGLTEILCALGYEDVIVGRDATSTSPPSILDVPVIADNSYAPNVELILDVEPDLLFADSMLPYNTEVYNQLIAAGITIFIADTSDPQPAAHSNTTVIDFSCDLMTKIATLLGDADAATEYVDYVQSYNSLVKERLENLTTADRPTVFLEWYQPYQTFVTPGLDNAGGINIAENQTEYAPNLSPEFVVEQNPDIIIRAISSNEHAEADFIAMRDEIMSRPELSSITAVQTGQVYIYDFAARGGIRCVVGYLCWAKWCQPDLFEDIDPTAINAEISQTFLGTDTTGVYCYP
jgi:iron complex transport system substrate-binding protein